MHDTQAFTVDEATIDDAAEIARIQHEGRLLTYVNPESEITEEDVLQKLGTIEGRAGRWRQRIKRSRETLRIFVIRDAGSVIGFCKVEKCEEENYLHTVYVDCAHLGRGVGSALLTHALAWLGSEKPIELRVISYNENAITFYTHLGFTIVGIAEPYDIGAGKSLPMTLMRKSINV